MTYHIAFDPIALEEVLEAARYIAIDSPMNAERWYQGIHKAVYSLSNMPERCALARENDKFDEELRQLVYHSHRIIFTVKGKTVHVMHVRHGARKELGEENG